MQVVILAGGLGTRFAEETDAKPKPMIEIGGKPILWHIIQRYVKYGFNKIIIAGGYKVDVIKSWFANYDLYTNKWSRSVYEHYGEKRIISWIDITPDHGGADRITVDVVDTGMNATTGSRLLQLKEMEVLNTDQPFFCTYGDGLANINFADQFKCYQTTVQSIYYKNQKIDGLVTVVHPLPRFGIIHFNSLGYIYSFQEKPPEKIWINGGFYIFRYDFLKKLTHTETLEQVVARSNFYAYQHTGFWQCMDTLRDQRYLEELAKGENPPWMS